VEEDPVARVEEKDDGSEHRGAAAEPARCKKPRGHRSRVEERHRRFRQRSVPDVEEPTDDERSDGRPPEHVAEVDRVGLEELRVSAEVGVEVAPAPERDRIGLDPPHHERDDEDRDDADSRLGGLGGPPREARCAGSPPHAWSVLTPPVTPRDAL
jgi:hypothetical protein